MHNYAIYVYNNNNEKIESNNMEPEWENERESKILRDIKQYAEDAYNDGVAVGFDDGHEAAYDQAWDEARNKGYDEGWSDACDYIMTKLLDDKSGLVYTPKDKKDLSTMIEAYQDKGTMCVIMMNNWLVDALQEMKVDDKCLIKNSL